MSAAIGSAANEPAKGGGRTPGGRLPQRQRPTTGAARQAQAQAAEAAGSGRGAGQRGRQAKARAAQAAQQEVDAPDDQAEEEIRNVGELDPWAQAAGIAPNSAPGNYPVGWTPPPQPARTPMATSAPGGLDAGRETHVERHQIGTPERRRPENEGFEGLTPVRGTGQNAGSQQQQQQEPWAQYQSPGRQGGAPAQPGSWGPQANQGTAMPLYGMVPPPPPYTSAYPPGDQQQQQPTGLYFF